MSTHICPTCGGPIEEENILNRSVQTLELSARAWNILQSADIETVGELAAKLKEDFLRLRNCGKRTVMELEEVLTPLGIVLKSKAMIDAEQFEQQFGSLTSFDEILSTLSPREEKIIRLHFGLKSEACPEVDRQHTLKEIAQHFIVTRERIRQIEAKALRKLRWPPRLQALYRILGVPTEAVPWPEPYRKLGERLKS